MTIYKKSLIPSLNKKFYKISSDNNNTNFQEEMLFLKELMGNSINV